MKRSISVLATLSIVIGSLAPSYVAIADVNQPESEKVNVVVQNDDTQRGLRLGINHSSNGLSISADKKFVAWSGDVEVDKPIVLTDMSSSGKDVAVKAMRTDDITILCPDLDVSILNKMFSLHNENFYNSSKSFSLFLKSDKGWMKTSEENPKIDFCCGTSSFNVFDNENVLVPNKLNNKEFGWSIQRDRNGYLITKSINDKCFVLAADSQRKLKLISRDEVDREHQESLIFKYKNNQLYNDSVRLKLKVYRKDTKPTYVVRTSQFYHTDKSSEYSNDKEDGQEGISVRSENLLADKKNLNKTEKEYNNKTSVTISIDSKNIPYNVTQLTVSLMDGSKVVKTITVDKKSGWKSEIKDLPLTNTSGQTIDYRAKIDLDGYSSSDVVTRQDASDYNGGHVIVPVLSPSNGESYYLLTSSDKGKVTSLLRKTNILEASSSVSSVNIGTVQDKPLYDSQGNLINQYVKFKSSDDVSYLQWTAKNGNQGTIFESNFMQQTSGKSDFVLEGMNGTYKCVKNEGQSGTLFQKTADAGYEANGATVYPYKEVQVGNHISIDLSLTKNQESKPDNPVEDIDDFVQFTVNKKWDSNSHPNQVKVHLKANGVEKDSQVLNDTNNWTYTWKNLPLKDSFGNEIQYTVSEDETNGYTADYSNIKNDGTTQDTVWLPATHWKDNHEYIMVASPNVGPVNALEDCGKKWEWNGHKITVSGSPGAEWPNGTYITNEEARKNGGSFIWKTELYKKGAKIDHLNGLHDLYTLVGHNGKIASLQGAQDMVDYNHRKQTNCQWFYGDYAGGKNQPNVPKEDWPNVMGGANFYYILSNGGTGDGNHKEIPVWYAYEKHNITIKKQSMTITNKANKPLPPQKCDLNIHKISSDTGASLEGAEFKLTLKSDPKQSYTASTNEDGMIFFNDLPFGTYILQETKAPDGYQLNDKKYEIEISEDGVKVLNSDGNIITINDSLTISNKKKVGGPVLPGTGGPGNFIFMWIGFLMIGITVVFNLYNRRKEEKDEH